MSTMSTQSVASQKVISFLAIHPSLCYLDLSVQGISQETFEKVVKAITEHPGLRSLRLMLSLEITQLRLDCLFSCITRLETLSLHLQGTYHFAEADPGLETFRKVITESSVSRIRTLQMTIEDPALEEVLFPTLVTRLPLLESIDVPYLTLSSEELDPITACVRESCPILKYLSFGSHADANISYPSFLKACQGGLGTLRIQHDDLPYYSLVDAIVPPHAQTLTSLVFTLVTSIDPETHGFFL